MGERARRRGSIEALTTTILASTVVAWRGTPLVPSRDLLADIRGGHPGYARLRLSLRREFDRLASDAQLPLDEQLHALRAAADLHSHHGMTSDELKTASAVQAVGGGRRTRPGRQRPRRRHCPGLDLLCQQLMQAGYEQLLEDPDWVRRRR